MVACSTCIPYVFKTVVKISTDVLISDKPAILAFVAVVKRFRAFSASNAADKISYIPLDISLVACPYAIDKFSTPNVRRSISGNWSVPNIVLTSAILVSNSRYALTDS